MKSVTILSLAAASLAAAGPIDLLKRVWQTEVVVQWTTVYVTEGSVPTDSPNAAGHRHGRPTTHITMTTSTTGASSSSSTPVVVVLETPVAAPAAPSTTAALQPLTSSTNTAEPAPAATKAPVAEVPAPVVASVASHIAATSVANEAAAPTDFESTVVYHHNIHRLNYSAPAIEWGQTYADYAAQTAAKCKFAHDLTPGGGGYGQNLAMWATTGDAKSLGENMAIAQAITDMWHNGECMAYPKEDYGKDSPNMTNFEVWGHFSQLVWVGSKVVGCKAQYCEPGTMYDNMGAWFSVCNYYPAGNMGGQYGKNVLPPLNEPTVVA